ncbi:hypothetical protein CHS0354_037591 [Potamilus streckersoni]|uniref:Uncharacterized protein n=1 Tax=Potamilus streckersoni TaxID=2493646 RepID=A0AAE0RYK0_9BIVA|nr:hypothetical protein CHS0354_037591 [Potamilus streckersoni]
MNSVVNNNNNSLTLLSLHTSQNNFVDPTESSSDYDTHGAMLFIVFTMTVYSMGIVLFIASHFHAKHPHAEEEGQISSYLKSRNLQDQTHRLHLLNEIRQTLSHRDENRLAPSSDSSKSTSQECHQDLTKNNSDEMGDDFYYRVNRQ